MDFKQKYLKYKNKYIKLQQIAGSGVGIDDDTAKDSRANPRADLMDDIFLNFPADVTDTRADVTDPRVVSHAPVPHVGIMDDDFLIFPAFPADVTDTSVVSHTPVPYVDIMDDISLNSDIKIMKCDGVQKYNYQRLTFHFLLVTLNKTSFIDQRVLNSLVKNWNFRSTENTISFTNNERDILVAYKILLDKLSISVVDKVLAKLDYYLSSNVTSYAGPGYNIQEGALIHISNTESFLYNYNKTLYIVNKHEIQKLSTLYSMEKLKDLLNKLDIEYLSYMTDLDTIKDPSIGINIDIDEIRYKFIDKKFKLDTDNTKEFHLFTPLYRSGYSPPIFYPILKVKCTDINDLLAKITDIFETFEIYYMFYPETCTFEFLTIKIDVDFFSRLIIKKDAVENNIFYLFFANNRPKQDNIYNDFIKIFYGIFIQDYHTQEHLDKIYKLFLKNINKSNISMIHYINDETILGHTHSNNTFSKLIDDMSNESFSDFVKRLFDILFTPNKSIIFKTSILIYLYKCTDRLFFFYDIIKEIPNVRKKIKSIVNAKYRFNTGNNSDILILYDDVQTIHPIILLNDLFIFAHLKYYASLVYKIIIREDRMLFIKHIKQLDEE